MTVFLLRREKMCNIKYFIMIFLIYATIGNTNGMSVKQVQAAVKMVRGMCQPKTKATLEDIDKMHQGDWNIDHNAMCYMYCSMNTYKLIDADNKFDLEAGMKQVHLLPEIYKDASVKCMTDCKDAAPVLDDKCVAAYEYAKCFYFCSPETYFLP